VKTKEAGVEIPTFVDAIRLDVRHDSFDVHGRLSIERPSTKSICVHIQAKSSDEYEAA
jgi:hypothetical protein